jgi:putative endonuclease
MIKDERKELGRRAEQMAADFLLREGYQILERNLVFKQGEIDILAKKEGVIVVVEVKSREGKLVMDPIYKIDLPKQQKLFLLGRIIEQKYPEQFIRIDAITIYWENKNMTVSLKHYQNILN